MYAKSTRPSAKRDDRIARPRRAQTFEGKTKRTTASTSESQPMAKRTQVGREGPQPIFSGLHPPGTWPTGETSIAPTDIDISPRRTAAASNDLTAINCDQWERQSNEILDCDAEVPESEDIDMRGE